MTAPQTTISVVDLTLYSPRSSNAIMGCVGPATRGPINALTDFTDEGNFVSAHGEPVDRMYSGRACGRYFKRGSSLKFVRIGGPNLNAATTTVYAADGITPILLFTAASEGSWANSDAPQYLGVAITHNGTQSYNVQIYEKGVLTDEQYIGVDNGTVVSRINTTSTRVTVQLASGAGTTFPGATLNPVTGAISPVTFSGGDDGAFAKSESESSSTSGVAGRRFFGKMDTTSGSREWETVIDIDATLAGLDVAHGSLGHAAVPGTVTIRAQTGASTWEELADSGDLSYGPGGAGMGILEGTSIVGYIDYRTGAFGIDISGAATTFFSGGEIQAIWTKAASESVGAAVAGLGEYAGNFSRFPLAPGFFSAGRSVITVPIDEVCGTAPLGGASAASSVATLKTLAGWIIPGTVVLTPTHSTATVPPPIYDDGFGGFRTAPIGQPGVAVTGTINYRTGQWSVTTWDPVGSVVFPGTAADINAEYDIQLLNVGGAVPGAAGSYQTQTVQVSHPGGTATADDTDVGAQRIVAPVAPGSVILTISAVGGNPETYYDDGVGHWLDRPRGDPRAAASAGGLSDAIDYVTGEWAITATGNIDAAAQISVTYTQVPTDQARRALAGTGPQYEADTTANAAGLDIATAPASANDYNGENYLDHTTGAFAFKLDLTSAGVGDFNVKDAGTLTAVYLPVAGILGFGDGTETVFTGALSPAPFRRQDDRLVAFQAGQVALAGAGDSQIALATLGADASLDHWTQNVAAPSDPDNFIDMRDGSTSIQWTGAPALDEAVFVAAEEVVLHLTARYPGDIGNERSTMTEGFWARFGPDATVAGTYKLEVMFENTPIETFGQAATLDELADDVNDNVNGSDYVRVTVTDDAGIIDADVTASQSIGLAGAFTAADIIGTRVGSTYTGLQAFRNHEVVPVDWLMIPGQWHASVINAMRELCEKPGRRCIGIIPVPETDDAFEVRDFVNGEWDSGPGLPPVPSARVPYPPTTGIDSSQLCVFDTWVTYLDEYADEVVMEDHAGDIAALVADVDNRQRPWYPIAGGKRGRLLAEGLKYSTPLEDRNLIYGPVGSRTEIVNSMVAFSGRGPQLVGQRTAQRSPTALDRLNVRWTVNVIANRIDEGSREFQFELNDTILWREIKGFIEDILAPIKAERGLQDYYVVVDSTTTTATDIDNLRVKAKIFIKPARATEYLDFSIILTSTGADFADVSASSV